MPPIRLPLALLVFAVAPAAALATQWQVDAAASCPGSGTAAAPFCAIQSALAAAASGDEIVVAPGVYFENLDFLGKDVWLHSSAGALLTTVDAGGAGSVVTFANGEGPGAVLEGFTLRGGSGTDVGDPYYPTMGGGILCRGTSPTILDNVVDGCYAGRGGGIALLGGAPFLKGNTIQNCSANDGAGVHCGAGSTATLVSNSIITNGSTSMGGGIEVADAAPLIAENIVEGNHCSSGAGITVNSTLAVVIRGNVIQDNWTDEDQGGGLSIVGASTLIEENQIVDNFALGPGGGVVAYGGTFRKNRIADNVGTEASGVFVDGDVTFDGDVLEGNHGAESGLLSQGATLLLKRVTVRGNENLGITLVQGAAVLEDCLVADNDEGLQVSNSTTTATVRRCTFAGNTYRGVVTYDGGYASITGAIVWGNGLTTAFELDPGTGAIDAAGSIVRGGYPGSGNQNVDPLYLDPSAGNYELQAVSPAVDAGDPADQPSGTDPADHPRWLDGNLDRIRVVDLGAFEFDNAQLALTADARPGGTLTLDLTGTNGLQGFSVVGLGLNELQWSPFGALLVDLSVSTWIFPIAALPIHLSGTIPPTVPDGTLFAFQGIAVALASGAGNLSNVATVVVRTP